MPLKKNGLGLLGVLSVVGIAAVIATPYLGFGATSTITNPSNTDTHTVAFDPETDLVPADARCVSNDYINSSTQVVKTGDVKYRQFATAVSIPFKGTTDDAVNKEIVSEICGNPTELKMVADDMMLWTGFPGADSNKAWLKTVVNDLNTSGLNSFIAKKTQDGGLVVSEKFQKYAGWINTVLLRFNTNGKQSLTSVRNWELPATVSPTTQPVAVKASDQESKPAWVRTLMDKNGKCLYKIGFNAEDKRIETFNCVVPKPPTTTTTTPGCTTNCGSSTHKCTSNCGSTPHCTSNCTPVVHVCPPSMPHGTWPVCKDSPSKAPNGSDGNGLSHDPTPTTPSPKPTQPPSTPRTNPVPPAPSPAPTLKPDPAPAPAPEPSAPTPSDPATGCSPAPGMTTC